MIFNVKFSFFDSLTSAPDALVSMTENFMHLVLAHAIFLNFES
jgi:hypothetical protein